MKLGWNSMWVFWTSILNSLKGSQNPKNKQNASILALKVDFFSCAFAAKACGFHAFAVAQGFRAVFIHFRAFAPRPGRFRILPDHGKKGSMNDRWRCLSAEKNRSFFSDTHHLGLDHAPERPLPLPKVLLDPLASAPNTALRTPGCSGTLAPSAPRVSQDA